MGEGGARADRPPRSAVSHGVGLVGLTGFAAWLVLARAYGLGGPFAALGLLGACAGPMLLWSLLVDKVHHHETTGIDWARPPRPLAEALDTGLVKLAGLWATWGVIALLYIVGNWLGAWQYRFVLGLLGWAAPALLLCSIPYVIWLDRRLVEPRDGAHACGLWLLGRGGAAPREALYDHGRSWAVKGFFIAFMLSVLPGSYAFVVGAGFGGVLTDPASSARLLIALLFLIDIAFATLGYLLTFRPLDAHIRSANPYLAGWTAALICYPPFVLMGPGGPLDYHRDTADWSHWLADYPAASWAMGALLVLLTALYAWATVAFGLRFSNLTHRGILTHGPYRWSKHPAYLAKNAFWWLSTLPFLVTTGDPLDRARNTALLAVVSAIYYWRARTEEAHLSADPAYRAYAAWMERNAPLSRLVRRLNVSRSAFLRKPG